MAAEAQAQAKLWYWQRISAMVLAVCVIVHLATIVYAVRGGLTAAEILERTQGNLGWAAFYVVFVAAVAVHAPIGLARIAEEWFGWSGRASARLALLIGIALLALGLRAVYAVVAVR
ncbi:MAG TPA: succinate dehydrogenase [Burkholderiaceae bacterium]|jgi:fumarate reductase subunit C|nr:succinate dehydrogenase [Burkholderiaceae bacterium]